MDRRISAASGNKSIHSSIQVWVIWQWNWLSLLTDQRK